MSCFQCEELGSDSGCGQLLMFRGTSFPPALEIKNARQAGQKKAGMGEV